MYAYMIEYVFLFCLKDFQAIVLFSLSLSSFLLQEWKR